MLILVADCVYFRMTRTGMGTIHLTVEYTDGKKSNSVRMSVNMGVEYGCAGYLQLRYKANGTLWYAIIRNLLLGSGWTHNQYGRILKHVTERIIH